MGFKYQRYQPKPILLAGALLFAAAASTFGQAISTTSNALDRINFGDIGTDAYSEASHAFVNMGNPTGVGGLGLTYREIAPSATSADIGNAAYNEALTFTMVCSPTLQNYLTIQLWGSDTTPDVIYLYTAAQGYNTSYYYATNQPELDFQLSDPVLPGRFFYETTPIPLSMTYGKTSVTLTLNAARSDNYYAGSSTATANLAKGQTSRPIYAAFTHTNPYLILNGGDPQGTAPSASNPAPPNFNSTYLSSILSSIGTQVQNVLNNQIFGLSWSSAVVSGKVPAEIYGYFDSGKSPTNSYTTAEWLNNAAVDTSASNNVRMERLDMVAFAYVTPNFLPEFYQNSNVEQAIVAALDSYSYMQALNGCWGDIVAWDGVGATTATTSNPYGRANAQCSPIEGAGTYALGSAIFQMQQDPAFLAALNQPINSTLEPGIMRYQAYQTMLVNNMNFLNGPIGPGHAPNQDMLQARSYIYSNLALQFLDQKYGTSLALSNSKMLVYVEVAAGLGLDEYGGVWVSSGGLGLEVNGTGNGSYDGGYGLNDMNDLVLIAKILNDNGIETSSFHPVRTVALNAIHAFSNFIYPSIAIAGIRYDNYYREEEDITFRKNLNIGEIESSSNYFDAIDFDDPYAIHAFYLEYANGSTWSVPSSGASGFEDTVDGYMREFADYSALCTMVNTESDPSGINFLNETAHADGVWADPDGSTIAIKHNGEKLDMVLNFRPLGNPDTNLKPSASAEVVNNLARVHDTTTTIDRIATVMMPYSVATGASGSYASGTYGTLYVGRYGNYLVGLNWRSSAATMTLAPDMTSGTATDLVSGENYDLTGTTSVPVPAAGAVALYQSLPTATLNASSIAFAPTPAYSTAPFQTVTLTNSGTGPLLIGTIGIAGTNASDFSYTTSCGNTLAVNASCNFTVSFSPQAVGARAATLYVKTCLSATAQTITLQGTGSTPQVTVSISATPATVTYGSSTTLSATVSGAEVTPTGTVTFYDGGTSLGATSLNSGIATLATLSLVPGSHSISAVYGGDTNYPSATSSSYTVTVNPVAPTLSWAAPTAIAYGTTLSTLQLDATAAGVGGTILPGTLVYSPALGTALPAGTQPLSVAFTPTDIADYTTASTTVLLTVNKQALSVTANNQSMSYGSTLPALTGTLSGVISGDGITASYSTIGTSSSTVGAYPITATLNDPNAKLGNYSVSNTPGVLMIGMATPTLNWNAPALISYGVPLTSAQLDASSTVAGVYLYNPAAGTVPGAGTQMLSVKLTPSDSTDYTSVTANVSLTVNKASLSVTAGNASRPYGAVNPAFSGVLVGSVNGDTFTESFTTAAILTSPPGSYSIVPSISGTNIADYTVSATDGDLIVTQAASSTTLSSSALISVTGALVTFTATVAPATTGTPTGTVSFLDGSTQLGQHTLTASGTATFSTSSLVSGTHSITAQYSGDMNFTASNSAVISEVIATPQLTLTPASNSVSLASGGSTSVGLVLTPVGGFSGTVTLTCASPQSFITCSLPNSTTVGTSSSSVNVSISVASSIGSNQRPMRPNSGGNQTISLSLLPCGVLLLLPLKRRLRRGLRYACHFAGILLIASVFAGCGSNATMETTANLPAAGSYALALTASSSGLPQPSTATITVVVTN